MDRTLVAKLERLLSEVADEGATRERVEKIESLLLNNSELQDHYWSWMDVHVVLGTDRAAILGESTAASPAVPVSGQITRPKQSEPMDSPSQKYTRWWMAPALAVSASLLFVFLSGDFSWRQLNPNLGSAERTENWQIPKITRVSWEGPYFADPELEGDSASAAHVGLVSLGFVDGLTANGYVLRLDPGTTAELVMAADAYAENNLSVIELNASGKPIRRSVSFNNFGTGMVSMGEEGNTRTRRYGLIGTWSEFNDTDKPKYYLLNGIHKSENPDFPSPNSDQEFQLSKMVVDFDEPDLIMIGWDDGGIQSTEATVEVPADGDYDDITVVIRISGHGIDPIESNESYRMMTRSTFETPRVPQTEGATRFQFTLVPGETAVMNVASEARKTNAVYLVNEGTGDILWSAENSTTVSSSLDAIAIQNTSSLDMDLAIYGENTLMLHGQDARWESSLMSLIYSQPGCTILGFEDQDEGGDYDDIRVTIVSLLPDRNTPFDNPDRSKE